MDEADWLAPNLKLNATLKQALDEGVLEGEELRLYLKQLQAQTLDALMATIDATDDEPTDEA